MALMQSLPVITLLSMLQLANPSSCSGHTVLTSSVVASHQGNCIFFTVKAFPSDLQCDSYAFLSPRKDGVTLEYVGGGPVSIQDNGSCVFKVCTTAAGEAGCYCQPFSYGPAGNRTNFTYCFYNGTRIPPTTPPPSTPTPHSWSSHNGTDPGGSSGNPGTPSPIPSVIPIPSASPDLNQAGKAKAIGIGVGLSVVVLGLALLMLGLFVRFNPNLCKFRYFFNGHGGAGDRERDEAGRDTGRDIERQIVRNQEPAGKGGGTGENERNGTDGSGKEVNGDSENCGDTSFHEIATLRYRMRNRPGVKTTRDDAKLNWGSHCEVSSQPTTTPQCFQESSGVTTCSVTSFGEAHTEGSGCVQETESLSPENLMLSLCGRDFHYTTLSPPVYFQYYPSGGKVHATDDGKEDQYQCTDMDEISAERSTITVGKQQLLVKNFFSASSEKQENPAENFFLSDSLEKHQLLPDTFFSDSLDCCADDTIEVWEESEKFVLCVQETCSGQIGDKVEVAGESQAHDSPLKVACCHPTKHPLGDVNVFSAKLNKKIHAPCCGNCKMKPQQEHSLKPVYKEPYFPGKIQDKEGWLECYTKRGFFSWWGGNQLFYFLLFLIMFVIPPLMSLVKLQGGAMDIIVNSLLVCVPSYRYFLTQCIIICLYPFININF